MTVTAKQRSLIENAFCSIPDIYDGFKLARDIIYDAAIECEKRHRQGISVRGAPATLTAKYFTVRWLAGYAMGRDQYPEIRDIHRIKEECYLSASFAADYPEQFMAWGRTVPADFWAIDYAEMVGD